MKTTKSPSLSLGRQAAGYAAAWLVVAAAGLSACSKDKDKQESPAPAVDPAASSQQAISLLPPTPSLIPDTLQAPANAVLLASVVGIGVQVYEVRPTAADSQQYTWAFVAPEATLYGADNLVVGRHYAGPTWASNDSSTVVGRVLVSQPAPRSTFNIPWLLLTNRRNTGTGIFSRVRYVQRLNTLGGQAPPAQTATRATLGRRVRIPYKATYVFYGTRP